MKEWFNTDTGEFKTLEDSIVIKGINWVKVPEGTIKITKDGGTITFWSSDTVSMNYGYGDWEDSVDGDVMDFNEYCSYSFEVVWEREKERVNKNISTVNHSLHDNVENNSVVSHPKHYVSDPCGVEAIEITSLLPACISNTTKYIWREGKKDSSLQELEKALWYINYSIDNNLPSSVNDLTDSMHFEELITKVKKHWSGWKYIFIDAVYWGDQQQMKRAIEGMINKIKE